MKELINRYLICNRETNRHSRIDHKSIQWRNKEKMKSNGSSRQSKLVARLMQDKLKCKVTKMNNERENTWLCRWRNLDTKNKWCWNKREWLNLKEKKWEDGKNKKLNRNTKNVWLKRNAWLERRKKKWDEWKCLKWNLLRNFRQLKMCKSRLTKISRML